MKRSYTPLICKPHEIPNKKENAELTEEEKERLKKLKNRQSALESRRKAKEKLLKLEKAVLQLEKEQAHLIAENKRLKGQTNDDTKPKSLPPSPPPVASVSPITISSTPPPVESNYHQSQPTGQSDQNWSLSNFGPYSSAPILPASSIFGSLAPTRLNSTTPYFPVAPNMQPTYQSTPPQLFMDMLDDRQRGHYNPPQEPDFDDFLSGLMQL